MRLNTTTLAIVILMAWMTPVAFATDTDSRTLTFIMVDVPGSTGTHATAINDAGDVAGMFEDTLGVHGFLRERNGKVTTFDVPGWLYRTVAINQNDEIIGWFMDETLHVRGFLRKRNGEITTLTVSGADTVPQSINARGQIAGFYIGPNYSPHGFLRESDGTVTLFDAPNSVSTSAYSINDKGQIVGYVDENISSWHGFLREPEGTFTTIEGAPYLINQTGHIAGIGPYTAQVPKAFLREPDGTMSFFTSSAYRNFVQPQAMNPRGEIVGLDSNPAVWHGFLREADGTYHILRAPGAMHTWVYGINSSGQFVGYCVCGTGLSYRGFIGSLDGK